LKRGGAAGWSPPRAGSAGESRNKGASGRLRPPVNLCGPMWELGTSAPSAYDWVIEADMEACFDRIRHDALMAEIER
jgi:hypothetical protein